jgi:hypothetical protein
MRTGALLFLGLLTCPAIGSSQVQAWGPAPSILFSSIDGEALPAARVGASLDSVRRQIRPTYWKEGALIGGGIGVLLGAWLGHGLCGLSDEFGKNCTGSLVVGGMVGAVLLAIPGALVGGQFPKGSGGDQQPSS